jgi:anti-anti-sigma factor
MFACSEAEDFGLKWLILSGRIDAMSAGEINRKLDALLTAGERIVGADLEQVNYVSSAGIRVFLAAQKKLIRVHGQIVMAHVRPDVLDVLKMSGLDTVFCIAATREDAGREVRREPKEPEPLSKTINGIRFTCLKKEERPGSLTLIGDTKRLIHAAYEAEDVVTVPSSDMKFGLGLGSLGQEWDHFKGLFGEAMVIDRHLFFYPAVKNPAVDFMLWSEGNPPIAYRFLNGLAFEGAYQYVASFETGDRPASLEDLIKALFQISDAPLLGIVILGESRGIWGMHLKRVPVKGLWTGPEQDILSPARIQDWMDLPVEPGFVYHIVVAVGIAVRERGLAPLWVKACIPKGQDFHVHGVIFGKGLFNSDPTGFEHEVKRIVSEFEALRIQHLMGRSLLRNGVVGVVEIEAGETDGALDRRP